MSTYTINGIRIEWSSTDFDTPVDAGSAELVVYAPDTTTGFTYDIIYYEGWDYEAGDFRDVDVNAVIYGFDLNGTYYPETDDSWENAFGRIVWNGNTTYVLTFWQMDSDVEYLIPVAGAALPTMNTLADFENFFALVDFNLTGAVTSGAYSEGNFISLASAPGVVVGPTIVPTDPDQNIVGTLGDDYLQGGTGDDTINPLSNSFGEDRVDGSAGDDTIIYTDSTLDSWQILAYSDFSGITANIDGFANTGSVDKGGLGVDTITDVNVPLDWNSWGFGMAGSTGDDTFNLDIADQQWIGIWAGAGDNTFNLNIEGMVRLNYNWDGDLGGPTSGIVANLRAGTVSNNGFGGHDTINYTNSGGRLQLRGTDFGDEVIGSDYGDDFLMRGGDDTVDGGAGVDEIRYDRSGNDSGVMVDLSAGTATGTWYGTGFTDTLSNIENVRGSGYNDELTGDSADNLLRGRSGDDTLTSVGGNDTLMGEDGSDTYIVELFNGGDTLINDYSGSDMLVVVGTSEETGGTAVYDSSAMAYTFTSNAGGSITIAMDVYGYTSVEYVTFTDADNTFSSDFQLVYDAGMAYQSNAFVAGTTGADSVYLLEMTNDGEAMVMVGDGDDYVGLADSYGARVVGGAGNDTVDGGASNDSISGGAGDDSLSGGAGDDTLDGGAGGDTFDGGDGYDIVSYESATRSVRVDLQNPAYMYNDAVGDTFVNVEAFQTGDYSDQLRGDANGNEFYTGGLSDRLYGRAGDDFLFGETGADAFYGGTGSDTMTAGDDAGRRDRFIYFNIVESGVGAGSRDVITDFVSGEDRIEISRFDADITQGFKQRFDFVGDAGLSGVAGELAYVHDGGNTIVQADVNGDGVADFEIELTGIMDLTAADFLI